MNYFERRRLRKLQQQKYEVERTLAYQHALLPSLRPDRATVMMAQIKSAETHLEQIKEQLGEVTNEPVRLSRVA